MQQPNLLVNLGHVQMPDIWERRPRTGDAGSACRSDVCHSPDAPRTRLMRTRAALIAAFAIALGVLAPSGSVAQPVCKGHDGRVLRDEAWRHRQTHPLIGRVFKNGEPIPLDGASCIRSPLQQLIVEAWQVIRGGGLVLLGEVHDNPEHHRVRGDILWPRLEPSLVTRDSRPAAVFEHIRSDQRAQLDRFYHMAARSRRLWGADDLLRELDWHSSGWPQGELFKPLFGAALWAKLPIEPGNAPRARVRALTHGEPRDASPAEAARLSLARAMPEELVAALAGELAASHCGIVPAAAFGAMSLAQRYMDAHLAGRLVEAADTHGSAFLLAGNGHVRSDRGVPWYTRRLAPGRRTLAVLLLEVVEGQDDGRRYIPRGPDGAAAADYILFTPRQARPDPCAEMRQGRP